MCKSCNAITLLEWSRNGFADVFYHACVVAAHNSTVITTGVKGGPVGRIERDGDRLDQYIVIWEPRVRNGAEDGLACSISDQTIVLHGGRRFRDLLGEIISL